MENTSFIRHPFIIFLRWVLFIPFEFIVLGLITNILFIFIGWLLKIGTGWFIAFLIFGSFLHGLISMLILLVIMFIVNFCPQPKVGAITCILIALSNCVYTLINIWRSFENSGSWEIFLLISFTFIHLYLLWFIFVGSISAFSDDY